MAKKTAGGKVTKKKKTAAAPAPSKKKEAAKAPAKAPAPKKKADTSKASKAPKAKAQEKPAKKPASAAKSAKSAKPEKPAKEAKGKKAGAAAEVKPAPKAPEPKKGAESKKTAPKPEAPVAKETKDAKGKKGKAAAPAADAKGSKSVKGSKGGAKGKGADSAPAPRQPGMRYSVATPEALDASRAAAARLAAAAGLHPVQPSSNGDLDEEPVVRLTKSPFNKKQLTHFKEVLRIKRAQLVGDVTAMENEALFGGGSGSLSHLPQHMADQGSDTYDQSLALDLAASQRTLLKEIDDALARIEEGTFGICEMLGTPIAAERLEETPWARFSIEAARRIERGAYAR